MGKKDLAVASSEEQDVSMENVETKKSKKSKKNKKEEESVPVEEVPVVEEVSEKKKKKKDKKKQEQEAASEEAQAPESQPEPELSKEERKRLKKERKQKEKEAEEQKQAPVQDGEEKEAEEPQKEKKDKKKKRKQAEETEATAQEPASEEPVLKKQKHKQEEQPSLSSSSSSSSSSFQPHFLRYVQHPEVAKMSAEALAAFRQENQIRISGSGDLSLFNPLSTFEQTGCDADVLAYVRQQKFAKPTPIQSQCWPVLLSGRDVIGIAETGSGKTLAFTLPALQHIKHEAPIKAAKFGKKNKNAVEEQGPLVLVLAPTRELAMQIAEVCQAAGQSLQYNTVCIYGGVDKYQQIQQIQQGVHFLVATPGRLLGLLREEVLSLKRVSYVVLDEADRMLDMGFEPDIRAIMAQIRPKFERQTLMFSATWPETVQKLASEFINNPIEIRIGKKHMNEDGSHSSNVTANERITQTVEVYQDDREKDARLLSLLQELHKAKGCKNRILIFVLYKKEVPRVERLLQNKGYKARGISGDKSQQDRTSALDNFKTAKEPLLIATDVAARGLDIPQVEYVINYSFPLTIEDYVHRIGRTGRGGNTGHAYTFFTKAEKHLSGELINLLRASNQNVPDDLMKFGTAVRRKPPSGGFGLSSSSADGPMKPRQRITFD